MGIGTKWEIVEMARFKMRSEKKLGRNMKVIPERATTKMGSNIQWNTESTVLYHLESNCGNHVCIMRN